MQRTAAGTLSFVDGSASVVVDDRSWPVVFATWFGEATVPLVEEYFAHHATLIERARAERTRIVLVTDTFGADRPSPKARKRIGELSAAQAATVAPHTLKSIVVIESALLRGVVTALAWIDPGLAQSENIASIEGAIERALALLDGAGIPRPKALTASGYRRPPRP